MYKPNLLPNTRVEVADILRGIAVAGIILIHTIEHAGFYVFPDQAPYNQAIWDVVFFLFSNKMYAIFACLFGFSFFVQHDNQAQKGNDYRLRFAWRMVLLFLFGIINCALYDGDILMIYALGGLLLIPFIRMNSEWVLAICIFLFMQPVELIYIVRTLLNPDTQPLSLNAGMHYGAINQALEGSSFWTACKVSLQHGFIANVYSAINNGRLTQTLLFFLLGILIGRTRLFYDEGNHVRIWRKMLIYGTLAFAVLWPAYEYIPAAMDITAAMNPALGKYVETMLDMWKNFSMVVIIMSGVVLAYYRTQCHHALSKISIYGKMSLSNYLCASLIGGFLFYGWGIGICHTFSHLANVFVALATIALQYLFCYLWAKKHQRGPLEELWRRLTWIFPPR